MATTYKVVVDGLVISWHRTEAAADAACARVRRSGRTPWGQVYGIATTVKDVPHNGPVGVEDGDIDR